LVASRQKINVNNSKLGIDFGAEMTQENMVVTLFLLNGISFVVLMIKVIYYEPLLPPWQENAYL
jgi:hypothetical protein